MSGAGMDSGMAVTIDASEASTNSHELASAFGLEDGARFRGALQIFVAEQGSGTPPLWRTIGPTNGVYSAVTAMGDARFLLTHPRVMKVRVLKFSDVTE